MVAIPLVSGTGATAQADFALVYPINLEQVPLDSGLSKGYVRSAAGAVAVSTGPGVDRGGIEDAQGVHYRVMGTSFVRVAADGSITTLGDVGGSGPVSLDYGFGRVAIRSGTSLWYWDGQTLSQVTDTDLGQCLDVVWMDGYYISTDGTSLIVSDLTNPASFNPIKYGSAEADPDMIVGLGRLRDELIAFGANTIEFYSDAETAGFPFQVNSGATIPIGCVGPQAKVRYDQSYAFVGGGRNQANAVWVVGGGQAKKLSTRTIDDLLAQVADTSTIQLEARIMRDEQRLLVHLPNRTLVCLNNATAANQAPVWYELRSGLGMDQAYRARNAVYAYGKWWVGDLNSAALGTLSDATADQFGSATGWQLQTVFLYNQAKGGIIHDLELVGLPGRDTSEQTVFASFTMDGQTWTQERAARAGKPGQRGKRVTWAPHKRFRNYMGLRFRGAGLAGWAALEAEVEPLNV